MGSLPEVIEDCFGVLQLHSDGSVYRADESEINFGNYNFSVNEIVGENCLVKWEEFMYDEKNQLYLRVYKPTFKENDNTIVNKKLHVVYYLHGGGFCLGSRTWPNCHNCCLRLCSQLEALVIAPDYRLAPEHRLPAAIEDGLNAIKWLQIQAKHLLAHVSTEKHYNDQNPCTNLLLNGVDFEKVFIIGDSSGGNIAHHMAVHLRSGSAELSPVRVCGYVLLGPFFGGSLRTKSEADGPPEPILTLDSLDRFWRLSLPLGENRDHPLANPFGPYSPNLEKVSLDPMMILVGGKEIMKDRVKDYARKLRNLGKCVTYIEFEGEYHGFFTHNPCSHVSNQLSKLIKQFISTRISC